MTIKELDDKLNSPGFQDTENGDLFYNFFIYQYPADKEYDIRRQIQEFKASLIRPTNYVDVLTLNLFDEFCHFLDQKIALFFVILKTYKICFDFQIRVTLRKWNGIAKSLTHEDLRMEFSEIASRDEFVNSWSESTLRKVSSAYLSILRKIGMLDKANGLHSVEAGNMDYYLKTGEPWFLEACLLPPFRIDQIKQLML